MSPFIASTQRTNAPSPLEMGLSESVHHDSVALLGRGQAPPAAGQYVHLNPVAGEVLRELADVAREAAFDYGRGLP